MSALNQSNEGCDWNSCHIISSFQEEDKKALVLSLPLVTSMTSGAVPKIDGVAYARVSADSPAVDGCISPFKPVVCTRG